MVHVVHKSTFSNEFGNYNSVFYLDDWVFKKDFALEKIKNKINLVYSKD